MLTYSQPKTVQYIKARVDRLSLKYKILAGIVIASAFILMCQFVMWYVAAAIIVAWTPFGAQYTIHLIKRDTRLAVYFIFIALQSIHMSEHVAQMVQIHLLFKSFANSHGLFGALFDVEWLHFWFDSIYIPFCMAYLLILYNGRDKWMLILIPLALWHAAEHVVIINYYIRTGISGSPGILASGGLIGSPLSRPDLHFLYNLGEETIIFLGFRNKLRRKGA